MSVPAPRTRQVVVQSAIMAMCHASSALAVLAVTPVILSGLGLESYGVWAILAAFVRYSSAADPGFGPSVTKYVSAYAAAAEWSRVRQVITFACLGYFTLAAVAFFPIRLVAGPLAVALHAPRAVIGEVPLLALTFSLTIFAMLLAGGLSSAIIGLGKLGLASALSGAGQFTFAICAVVAMVNHLGLPALCAALCMQYFIVAAVNVIVLYRTLGRSPFISPVKFEGAVIKRMFTFGGWVQLSGIMVLINAETNVVIIAAVVGLSAAGLFDLGNRLARLVRVISFYANSAVFPVLSRLDVEAGNEKVRGLFTTAMRGMAFVTVIAFCALAGSVPTVLHLWLGGAAPQGSLVMMIVIMLGIGYCADNIASVGSTILRAIGRPQLETFYQVVAAGINITLTLLLARRFGVPGILVGPASGALISSVIFLRMIGSDFGFPATGAAAPWLLPLAGIGALSATAAYAVGILLPHDPQRLPALVNLSVQMVVFGAVVVVGFRVANLLDPGDRERLRLVVPASLATLLLRVRRSVA